MADELVFELEITRLQAENERLRSVVAAARAFRHHETERHWAALDRAVDAYEASCSPDNWPCRE